MAEQTPATPDQSGNAPPLGGEPQPPALPEVAAQERAQTAAAQAGTGAQGFGSPYDPTSPPWPVRRDPARKALEQRDAEQRKAAEQAEQAGAKTYRFTGHRDAEEGSTILRFSTGDVQKGSTIRVSDEEVENARRLGFRLTAVDEPKTQQKKGGKA